MIEEVADVAVPVQTEARGDAMDGSAPRTCLLVLGMHRSGTSATSGFLHKLGAELPIRLLPAQADNVKGFFEPAEIVAIHDRILASAGMVWSDWEAMPASWMNSTASEAFHDCLVDAFENDFPGHGTVLLKDPRICRFADLWLKVLARLGVRPFVVFPFRHPSEVAASLKERNGFSVPHGLLSWLRHVLDAERATRETDRSFVSYGNLLIDGRAELASVVAARGVDLPNTSAKGFAAAEGFLDASLRHYRTRPDEAIHVWFAGCFEALECLRLDPFDPGAMAALDTIRSDFEIASAALCPALR